MRSAMFRGAVFCALFFALVPVRLANAEPAARHKHGKPPVEGVLNLNRASEAELRLLPGIGRGRAATIVARRQARPFANLEDVARIKGMRKLIEKLRSHLSVEGATTLRPIASAKANAALPAAARTTGPPSGA